jgi:hypothetical protein
MPDRVAGFALLGAVLAGCGGETVVYQGSDFTSDPPRPGPLNGMIVTTNNGDDTLSAFDLPTGAVRWSIPVGFIPVELEGPHHIVADPGGRSIYLNLSEAVVGSGVGPHGAHGTGTQPGFALKLSAADGSLVAAAQVDPNPGDLTLSADGATLYVTHYDLVKWTQGAQAGDLRRGDSNLAVIETATMTVRARVPLCPAAHGVRLSADGATLYATCGPDEIALVDPKNLAAGARRVLLPGQTEGASCERCPYAIGVAPDGTVWVSSLGPGGGGQGQGGVDVYDPGLAGFDPARRIRLCGRAVFAAFTGGAGGYTAWVPEQGCGDSVDGFTGGGPGVAPAPASRIALAAAQCVNAHMVQAFGATGYLVCEGDHLGPGSLVKLDLAAGGAAAGAALGVFPDGMALVPTRAP